LRNDRDEEDFERQADTIYLTSLLMGQIVIWLLVGLLVYSSIRLSLQSFSENAVKIVIVLLITVALIFLSVFMVKKGKKRVSMIRSRRD
jgi:predicted permease